MCSNTCMFVMTLFSFNHAGLSIVIKSLLSMLLSIIKNHAKCRLWFVYNLTHKQCVHVHKQVTPSPLVQTPSPFTCITVLSKLLQTNCYYIILPPILFLDDYYLIILDYGN